MKKKILINGSDGFIGSHLTELLVRDGYNVRAFLLYNSFNSKGWLDFCAPDVKNKFEFRHFFDVNLFDYIAVVVFGGQIL